MGILDFLRGFTGEEGRKVMDGVNRARKHKEGIAFGAGEVLRGGVGVSGKEIAGRMRQDSGLFWDSFNTDNLTQEAQATLNGLEERFAPAGSTFRGTRRMFARALFIGTRVAAYIGYSAFNAMTGGEATEGGMENAGKAVAFTMAGA